MEGQEAVSPSHVTYYLAKPPKEPTSLMALASLMVLRYIDNRHCTLMAPCVQLRTATATHCFSTITTAITSIFQLC
jgi:hypothetical protein